MTEAIVNQIIENDQKMNNLQSENTKLIICMVFSKWDNIEKNETNVLTEKVLTDLLNRFYDLKGW